MRMSFKSIAISALVLALAAPAMAGLSSKYARWADGPAGFLMTKQEKKEWNRIQTDEAAQRFIDLFWARRDPNLDTPYNEFKARFEGFVKYADENFKTEEERGALTDRGRVLIVLGTPYSVERRGPTETVQTIDKNSSGTDQVWDNAELWLYLPKDLPEKFKVKGSRLVYVFYEAKPASNRFYLDRTHREGTKGLHVLAKGPEVWLVHPELTEPPKPVSLAGGSPATADHLAWLSGTGALDGKALVYSTVGVADASHRPLWVHLEMPSEAPALDLLAGRVMDADGSVESTFEIAPTPLNTTGGTAYQLSFPLLTGSYTVELAGAAGGSPQVVAKIPATIPAVPEKEAWLAGPWTGVKAVRDDSVTLGAPFRFGILHLVPDVTGEVHRSDELSYFGFAVGLKGDQPKLQAKITLKRDGKRLGRPMSVALPVAQVADNLWVYASSLSLKGLPEAGDYDLQIQLKDPKSGASAGTAVALRVLD